MFKSARTMAVYVSDMEEAKRFYTSVLDEEPVQVDDETWTFRFEDPDGNILDACGGA